MKRIIFWVIAIIFNVLLEYLFIFFDVEILIKLPDTHLKFCIIATISVISVIGFLMEPPQKTHQVIMLAMGTWVLIPFFASFLASGINQSGDGSLFSFVHFAVMVSIVATAFFVMHFFYYAAFVAANVLLFLGWKKLQKSDGFKLTRHRST